jgi:hypothetical protein
MKLPKLLFKVFVLLPLLISSCKKDVKTDNSPSLNQQPTEKIASVNPATLSSIELQARLRRLKPLPEFSSKKTLDGISPFLLAMNQESYRAMVEGMTNAIEPTPCNSNTSLNQWLSQELLDWDQDVVNNAAITYMFELPAIYEYFFSTVSANQEFGLNGEYTQILAKTFKDLKRFWNIQSDDIALIAMHGSVLRDKAKLMQTYTVVFGLSPTDAEYYADLVLQLLHTYPQYRNGDHPIFSFNGIAAPKFNLPSNGVVPYRVILGDGVLDGYTAIGYGDVAPQALIAHEYGHILQYKLGLIRDIIDIDSPETSRRIELMADAFSAYYLSHARGAAMQWKRVKQFLQVTYNAGDCDFTNLYHHGTPTQRMAAADWAYTLASNAQKQGHILSVQEFIALFNAHFSEIIMH